MADYRRMYRLMFQAAEKAVRQLEENDMLGAVWTIKNAQLECEEIYIDTEDGCRERFGESFFLHTISLLKKRTGAPKRKLARGSKKPPLALPREPCGVVCKMHTAHPEEGIGWSDLPAYSHYGMSRFSVAKTYLVSMGVWGAAFWSPP